MFSQQSRVPSPGVTTESFTSTVADADTGDDRTTQGEVAAGRMLSADEKSHLQQILLSELVSSGCAGEDTSDLLEYVVAMVVHGKTVDVIVSELAEIPNDICDDRATKIIADKVAYFIRSISGAVDRGERQSVSATRSKVSGEETHSIEKSRDPVPGSASPTSIVSKSQEKAKATPQDEERKSLLSEGEVLSDLRTKKAGAATKAKSKAKRSYTEAELAESSSSDEEVLAKYRTKKKKKKKARRVQMPMKSPAHAQEKSSAKKSTSRSVAVIDRIHASVLHGVGERTSYVGLTAKRTEDFDPYNARMSCGMSPYYSTAPQALDGAGRDRARNLMTCFFQSRRSPRTVATSGKLIEIKKWKAKVAVPKGTESDLEPRKDVRRKALKEYQSHLRRHDANVDDVVLHYTFDDEMLQSDKFFTAAVELDCASRKNKKARKKRNSQSIARKKSTIEPCTTVETQYVQALLEQRKRPVEILHYKCEICQNAIFESFDECVAHESQCQDGKNHSPRKSTTVVEAGSSDVEHQPGPSQDSEVELPDKDLKASETATDPQNQSDPASNEGRCNSFDISDGTTERESQNILPAEPANKDEVNTANAARSQKGTQGAGFDRIERAPAFKVARGQNDVTDEVTARLDGACKGRAHTSRTKEEEEEREKEKVRKRAEQAEKADRDKGEEAKEKAAGGKEAEEEKENEDSVGMDEKDGAKADQGGGGRDGAKGGREPKADEGPKKDGNRGKHGPAGKDGEVGENGQDEADEADGDKGDGMASDTIQDEVGRSVKSSEKCFEDVEVAGEEMSGMTPSPVAIQRKQALAEKVPAMKPQGSQVLDLHVSDGPTVHTLTTVHSATSCTSSEERAMSLLFRQLKPSSKRDAMLCLHCKKHRWLDVSTLTTLAQKKSGVSAHMLKCDRCPKEIKAELRAAFERASVTEESSNMPPQESYSPRGVSSKDHDAPEEDSRKRSPKGVVDDAAEKSLRKGRNQRRRPRNGVIGPFTKHVPSAGGRGKWCCKRCRSLPECFRSKGSVSKTIPTDAFMLRHIKVCKGIKPDLAPMVQSIVELSSITAMKFDTLCEDDFKAIVRQLVGGVEDFVTLFTDDVRNVWYGLSDVPATDVGIDLWERFPFADIDGEAVLLSIAKFARGSGIGFEFVSNKSFARYVALIAPTYKLPSAQDLIGCW